MTINEFKAWLEGYEHSFTNKTPDSQQWAEVKRKFDMIQPVKAVQRQFVDTPFSPHTPWKV